jgi:hypothetical protein
MAIKTIHDHKEFILYLFYKEYTPRKTNNRDYVSSLILRTQLTLKHCHKMFDSTVIVSLLTAWVVCKPNVGDNGKVMCNVPVIEASSLCSFCQNAIYNWLKINVLLNEAGRPG